MLGRHRKSSKLPPIKEEEKEYNQSRTGRYRRCNTRVDGPSQCPHLLELSRHGKGCDTWIEGRLCEMVQSQRAHERKQKQAQKVISSQRISRNYLLLNREVGILFIHKFLAVGRRSPRYRSGIKSVVKNVRGMWHILTVKHTLPSPKKKITVG